MEFLAALLGVIVWSFFFIRDVYFIGAVGVRFDRNIIRRCLKKGISFNFAYSKLHPYQSLIKIRDELAAVDPEFAKTNPAEQFSIIIEMMDKKII